MFQIIIFGSYDICNRHNRGLDSALRGMSQSNFDLGVFHETKVTGGFTLENRDCSTPQSNSSLICLDSILSGDPKFLERLLCNCEKCDGKFPPYL